MTGTLYYNGALMATDTVRIDPADRGFTLGDGVFDTLLAIDGAPRYAEEHFDRLRRHAEAIRIPLKTFDVYAVFRDLLAANGFTAGRHAIRTTLTRGPGERGLALPENPVPTLIIRAAPVAVTAAPVTAVIARTVRRNEGSPLSRIKSLNYGDNILALAEARQRGADDAVLLNNRDAACCGSVSNLFVLLDGLWLTPPLQDGVLDGITRGRILNAGLGQEKSLTLDMLKNAQATCFSNSLAGLKPVSSLDGRFLDVQAVQSLASALGSPL